MIRWIFIILVFSTVSFTVPGDGLALSADSLVELKSAGVSDATIELMIAERTVETAALSVAEIVALKKAGIGDKTLQAVIRAGSFLKGTGTIVYGRATRPIRLSSAEDIIAMHRAGFSDTVLEAVLTAVNPAAGDDRQRAFDLLEGMNIRVDLRGE